MTEKVSVRIPHELTTWIDAEAERRKCDRSTVINDALRLAATAGEIKQMSLLIEDLTPLITSRLDRVEKWLIRSTAFGKAVAEKTQAKELAAQFYAEWQREGK
jgi:Arc/MetJ-type ribon-helix-helix transcriptional regulator